MTDVFANNGEAFLPLQIAQRKGNKAITTFTKGGKTKIKVVIHELKSMWEER